MIILLSKAQDASLTINSQTQTLDKGVIAYIGFEQGDDTSKFAKALKKIISTKLFSSDNSHFGNTLQDIDGTAMIISNFTLAGSLEKGNKPNFAKALKIDEAHALWREFVVYCGKHYDKCIFGKFQASMKITSTNNGPSNYVVRI